MRLTKRRIFVRIGHQIRINLSFSARRRRMLYENILRKTMAKIRYARYSSGVYKKTAYKADGINDSIISAVPRWSGPYLPLVIFRRKSLIMILIQQTAQL